MTADTYADRAREFAKVTRAVAEAVHEGGVRTGYQQATAEVRDAVLAEIAGVLRAEARRARGGRKSRAATYYADGLKRAAAIAEEMRRAT